MAVRDLSRREGTTSRKRALSMSSLDLGKNDESKALAEGNSTTVQLIVFYGRPEDPVPNGLRCHRRAPETVVWCAYAAGHEYIKVPK